MKVFLLTPFFLLLFSVFTSGQVKPPAPVKSGELIEKGTKLHDDKDYDGALEFYLKVPENDTNYLLSLYERSLTLLSMKKYKECIDVCREGMAKKSAFDSEFYITLGSAVDDSGDSIAAIAIYDQGLKRFPYNSMLHFNKAITLMKCKRYQEATEGLKNSLRYNPFHASSHFHLGMMALSDKNYVEALLAFNAFTIFEPLTTGEFTDRYHQVFTVINKLNEHEIELEPRNVKLSESGDDFETMELAILSASAMNKVKAKTKVQYTFVKRNQFMFSEFSKNEAKYSEGFFSEFYVPFYAALIKGGLFDEMTYFQLADYNDPKIQKIISKKDFIKLFIQNIIPLFQEKAAMHKVMYDGKVQKIRHWYTWTSNNSLRLQAIGRVHPTTKKNIGRWEFYNNVGSLDEINFYSEDGKRTGKWLSYFSTGELYSELSYDNDKATGYFRQYYKNGKLRVENELKDDFINGKGKSFFPDGTINGETVYKNSKAEGSQKIYHENNAVKYDATFVNDLLQGKLTEYYPDGKLRYEADYKEGKRVTTALYYYTNGNKEAEYNFIDNKKSGPFTTYYSNGQVYQKGTYKDENVIGKSTTWYKNGQMSAEEEYDEEGKLTGIQKLYDEDGKMYLECEYRKNAIVWYKYFDKDNKLYAEGKEDKGKLIFSGYSALGHKTVSGEYNKGKMEGTWKYYVRHGLLSYEIDYKYGKIAEKRTFYRNGKLSELIRYNKDEDRNGLYEAYYHNGKVKTYGYYTDGELNGYWYRFSIDGVLKSKSYYLAGTPYGDQINYDVNGKKTSLDYVDRSGNTTLYVYYDSTGKVRDSIDFSTTSGDLITHYLNGNKKFHGTYKVNNSHGKFLWLYADGTKELEAEYFMNDEVGTWKWYYENGKLSTVGKYVDGLKDSTWTYYFENGKMKRQTLYKNGDEIGESIEYYESGEIATKKTYKEGERTGPSHYYSEDGQLMIVKHFDKAWFTGYSYMLPNGEMSPVTPVAAEKMKVTSYYKNGKISSEFEVDKNDLNGSYIKYHSNGTVMEKLNYESDQMEGQREYYYQNGKLKLKEFYVNDELDGLCSYYDANGKLIKELSYKEDDLHGVCRYYNNGKLVKTRVYYDGMFVSEKAG
jgi:uncharacterized protein